MATIENIEPRTEVMTIPLTATPVDVSLPFGGSFHCDSTVRVIMENEEVELSQDQHYCVGGRDVQIRTVSGSGNIYVKRFKV